MTYLEDGLLISQRQRETRNVNFMESAFWTWIDRHAASACHQLNLCGNNSWHEFKKIPHHRKCVPSDETHSHSPAPFIKRFHKSST
jgi:hypothetical protein